MATMKLALESGGPKRLELKWASSWKDFNVTLDGQQVATVHGGDAALKSGTQVRLPDGSDLHLQLVKSALNWELQVLRHGQPLPGSPTDPAQRVQTAAHLLYFFAALNTVLGVLALVIDSDILQQMGMGVFSILFGGLVATLGFFTYRRSRVAPILAIVLYVSDALFTLATYQGAAGGSPPVAGIFIRVYVVMTLWRAYQASGELARQAESASAGLSPHP